MTTLLLMIALTLVALCLPETEGTAYHHRTATWNMQGHGDSTGISKWFRLSQYLLQHRSTNFDILALQESGRHPADARQNDNRPGLRVWRTEAHRGTNHVHVANDQHNVKEYTWTFGTGRNGRTYYVYHWEALGANGRGQPGMRTNMAIMSLRRAEHIVILSNGAWRRPVFGVQMGSDYFFTLHAPAFEGNNVAELVVQLEGHLRVEPNHPSWLIMGDFNRDVVDNGVLASNAHRQILQIADNTPTHRDTVKDYAVVGSTAALPHHPHPLMTSEQMLEPDNRNLEPQVLQSDHGAVMFIPRH